MLRNVVYIATSILIFFLGVVLYGIILNLREVTLDEALKEKEIQSISNPSIIIDRKNYSLTLYSDTLNVKTYKVVFGNNISSEKLSKNDFITPIGNYKICNIVPDINYYKKLKLNYPNIQDAGRGLYSKVISKIEYSTILNSLNNANCSYGYTKLGANISIQGIGKYNLIFKNLPFVFNWTNGSIAMSNENIDELIEVISIGTKVIIKN
ncbi:MAG: L,D-transpeptidase [Ignavibacteriae bacterium]|nr:L,D-transpeptidase [Ignavibacteriota bacterium]